jgi:(heptosyl)LPS beta-1,4-glucosyltransferase
MTYVSEPNLPLIGVVAIARNEERDLPGFLRNLLPWVDEIVIVDDGSTDRTREIIRSAGPKVRLVEHRMTREGGFAQQRNVGIAASNARWLLHMDIDERASPELAAEIRSAAAHSRHNAYRYRRLNYFLHRPMRAGGWQRWNKPQFARRGEHWFNNVVHEECVVYGGPGAVGQFSGEMWHLNDEDYVERVEKNLRYMQMTGDALLARGLKVRWYHMLFVPLYRALRAYLLDGAFRLGARGLLFSVYTFGSTFNWYAYAWDRQHRITRGDLEADLERRWRDHGVEDAKADRAVSSDVRQRAV